MYKIIKNNPGFYSINSLIKYYNECHIEKITMCANSIYQKFKQLYGNEIDVYLRYGMHSNEEYSFYKVLMFYLPHSKIQLGKKFKDFQNYYIYDIVIDNKLLIEYDSSGQYHLDKENDDNKEKYAKGLGYYFIRLTKNDIMKPETISKIIKLIN